MKDMFRKLQLFAEEGAEGGAGDAEASTAEDQEGTQGDQNGSGEAEPGQKPEKKYTDEDVDRIIARKSPLNGKECQSCLMMNSKRVNWIKEKGTC